MTRATRARPSSAIALRSSAPAARAVELQGLAVPAPHAGEHHHADERHHREPRDAALPVGEHDEGGEQRPDRRAEIAADLEHRLGEAVLSARGEARHPRGLGVEHRRSHADQRRRQQHHAVARGHRHDHEPDERRAHADDERIRRRMAVGDVADDRLQDRGGDLEREGDEPDLAEVERERALEHRVDRHDQRLDHVVEHVAQADGGEHQHGGLVRAAPVAGLCVGGHGLRLDRGAERGCGCSGRASCHVAPSRTTVRRSVR